MKTALIAVAIWIAASVPLGLVISLVIKRGHAPVLPPEEDDVRLDSAPPK